MLFGFDPIRLDQKTIVKDQHSPARIKPMFLVETLNWGA